MAPLRPSPRKHKSTQAKDMKYLRRSPRNHRSTQLEDLKHLRHSPRNHLSTRSGIVKPLRRRAEPRYIKPQRPSPERTLDGRPSKVAPCVFAIPELLEHILIQIMHNAQPKIYQIEQLPLNQNEKTTTIRKISSYSQLAHAKEVRTLFCLQRVNKAFQDTISGSKTLRKAMFLEHAHDGKDRDLLRFNPLIFELTPIIATTKSRAPTQVYGEMTDRLRYDWHRYEGSLDRSYIDDVFPARGKAIAPESFLPLQPKTQGGSWQMTLVSNMPVNISFDFRVEFEGRPRVKQNNHRLDKDAKLAWLMEILVQDLWRTAGCRRRGI